MGIVAFTGIASSTKSLAVIGTVVIVTYYLASKYMRKKKKGTGYMSYPARVYQGDINLHKIKAKIISVIAVDAKNKDQVAAVMDELVLLVDNYGPKLQNLIEERKTGLINHTGFLQKLRGIIDEIALSAGIEVTYKPDFIKM